MGGAQSRRDRGRTRDGSQGCGLWRRLPPRAGGGSRRRRPARRLHPRDARARPRRSSGTHLQTEGAWLPAPAGRWRAAGQTALPEARRVMLRPSTSPPGIHCARHAWFSRTAASIDPLEPRRLPGSRRLSARSRECLTAGSTPGAGDRGGRGRRGCEAAAAPGFPAGRPNGRSPLGTSPAPKVHHLQRRRGRSRRVHGPARAGVRPAQGASKGLAIAAYAIGAKHGLFYVRAEYPQAVRHVRRSDPAGTRSRLPRRQRPGHRPPTRDRGAGRARAPSCAARRRR